MIFYDGFITLLLSFLHLLISPINSLNGKLIKSVIWKHVDAKMDFPVGPVVKNMPVGNTGSIPQSGGSPGEGNGNHSSIQTWEIHWQRRLAGYSPQGCKESDMT